MALNDFSRILPPPVTQSGEEPIAAGGRQFRMTKHGRPEWNRQQFTAARDAVGWGTDRRGRPV